jgi:ubiquinone/menaquinone biosynthesis C-methylase UbiE
MSNSHSDHTGFIPRFNAWILHKGGEQYNRLTNERKQALFSDLSGQVLEIGPGAGANLAYYPPEVSLIALEPNPHMQYYLKKKAEELGVSIEIISEEAEHIPLDDESVDAVVSTLVLCSVTNLQQALSEIKRVLKPGGMFLFIEHVAACKGTFLRKIQQAIKPAWEWAADGCHTNRETWKAIQAAGFDKTNIEHFKLKIPVIRPHIAGKAVKESI